MLKTFAVSFVLLLSLAACSSEESAEASFDVEDGKADSPSCLVVASPLESFEAGSLPTDPDSVQRTRRVRMHRKNGLGACEKIESPWFRIDNDGDEPVTVQAKLGGVDKVFLRWLVRKVDASGQLVVQGKTADVLGPYGVELTGTIDGLGAQWAVATLEPGERLETIAIPNTLGFMGFGWFPLPTFSLSRLE